MAGNGRYATVDEEDSLRTLKAGSPRIFGIQHDEVSQAFLNEKLQQQLNKNNNLIHQRSAAPNDFLKSLCMTSGPIKKPFNRKSQRFSKRQLNAQQVALQRSISCQPLSQSLNLNMDQGDFIRPMKNKLADVNLVGNYWKYYHDSVKRGDQQLMFDEASILSESYDATS